MKRRSIGSGQMERARKNLIVSRMEGTSVCWRVERANCMADLCLPMNRQLWEIDRVSLAV